MSWIHYIDNEVPAYAEWDAAIAAGESRITQTTDAAWPDRGSYGLRLTTARAAAYVQKNTDIDVPAGGDVYMGFWYRPIQFHAAGHVELASAYETIFPFMRLYQYYDHRLYVYCYRDPGGAGIASYLLRNINRWHYIVVQLHRAATDVSADGYARLYVDGAVAATTGNEDNYDATASMGKYLQGAQSTFTAGFIGDFDETQIATSYPEPHVPTPTTDYPDDPRRIVVPYLPGVADSVTFADYCVSQLGLPRANLIALENGIGTETLASTTELQNYLLDDLDNYFALNPTVAANKTTFLLGYGVPHFFMDGGVRYSITSRLMRYGQAFSSQFDNPLYSPATVSRLTASTLSANNMHLACNIDADTLQHAKDILDAGITVAAGEANPNTDFLVSDDSDLRASLTVQHTRMRVSGTPPPYAAFTIADDILGLGIPRSTTGRLVAIVETGTNAQTSLRSDISEMTKGLLATGYAAGLGFSALPADEFDGEAFFEMLRIGGSFPEAAAVAVEHLDYTSVTVCGPTMTVPVDLSGYNLYRGATREAIDWLSPVAYQRAGVGQIEYAHADDTEWWYGLTSVSSSGVESTTKRVIRVRVADGAIAGPQPNALVFCRVAAAAGGEIGYEFQYNSGGAQGAATGVQFARCSGPGGQGADWEAPLDTIAISGDGFRSGTLTGTFEDGETVHLAARAVTAAGDGGPLTVPEGSPVAADTTGPPAINYVGATQN